MIMITRLSDYLLAQKRAPLGAAPPIRSQPRFLVYIPWLHCEKATRTLSYITSLLDSTTILANFQALAMW